MTFVDRISGIAFLAISIGLIHLARADEAPLERVDFNRDIRPVLADLCFHCHGPDPAQRKADLRFDTQTGAMADLGNGRHAIVAGHPEQSELIRRITSTDPDEQMPPPSLDRQISPQQIELFRRWIEQDAKWDAHWSFVRPTKAKLPLVKKSDWLRSPIDGFILEKLEHEQLQPSRPAERTTLVRRMTLDLTGLPPTPDDVREFVLDESPDAAERLTDRLLASPRYGERMAIRWMNGARYADTNGYQSDGERTMWRWRDWVIDAYNDNLPFDRFTVEQLAGDLLPSPTIEQRIATGFNRNHRGNAEGGIVPEEYAMEYVVDRVETTSTVWLGLTTNCARCHNHKYDPIAQTDFYQLFAFFNNIPEKGRAIKYGNSPPTLLSPTRHQQQELLRLESRVAEAESNWASFQAEIDRSLTEWERSSVPDLVAADVVRRGLILQYPLDGNAVAAFTAPSATARPAGYLGQTRSATAPVTETLRSETGEPQFANARFGQALACDGTRYAAVGDVANFGFFDNFSVSAWIRPDRGQGGTIVSRMVDTLHGDGWCVVLEGGKLQVHLTKRWLDDACRIETAGPINTDDWRHVTVTYDGTRETSGLRIYVDGELQPILSLLDELNQSFDNKGLLRIGGGNGPTGRFHGLIDDVRIFDRALSDEEAKIVAADDRLSTLTKITKADRTPAQSAALRHYFVENAATESIRSAWKQLQSVRQRRTQYVGELPTTMIMQEMSKPRQTHVLLRGEYDKIGEPVFANVPASLPPLRSDAPRNRLGLAQWLVDPDHPLTSRVAVNRCWQMLFGTGLVKTIDDFGLQGEWPSHPKLLDWLAVEFQEGDPNRAPGQNTASITSRRWDTKRLLRTIMTSSTYQQTSQTTTELIQRDPENRLAARGPRFRLSAEMVRDQALAASGLLVEQLGGPSFKSYQPDGLWRDLAGLEYDQDHGSKLYRRSLYIFWKRTIAPPTMITFDAASRETCIVKETRTNTPLQALTLMNDVTYVEASRMLGERMMLEADSSPTERINRAFELVLGRRPRPVESGVLISGYERHLSYFQSHTDAADALTRQGEHPRKSDLNVPELATCSTIAGLILNLDEAITRE